MPGRYCCVTSCHSRSHDAYGNKIDNGIRFFGFPTWKKHEGELVAEVTRRRRMAWIAAVRRKDVTFSRISKAMRVCSLHFHSGEPSYEMLENHPDWKPSLMLGHSVVGATDRERVERRAKRKVTAGWRAEEPRDKEVCRGGVVVVEAEQPADWDPEEPPDPSAEEPPDPNSRDCTFCRCRRGLINRLLEENRQMKVELEKHRMNEQFLKGDDAKVNYYTGLPSFAVLQMLLSNVVSFLPEGQKKLTPFQTLLLTLMRLRLNLSVQHLGHLFQVHTATAAAAFQETVGVLHTRLSPLVRWPARENLLARTPRAFVESFGEHVAAIVDCFEISTERPTTTQRQDDDALKYLIVVTPQGVISFISKGRDGRSSDKQITESCGFLDRLLPGDVVLAGRGFDVGDSEGLMCAEVKAPATTNGCAQLDVRDVEETRSVSHLRARVEKVVGVVRNKYKILHSRIPTSMLLPREGEDVTFLDKVVSVCCALTNMCPAVV